MAAATLPKTDSGQELVRLLEQRRSDALRLWERSVLPEVALGLSFYEGRQWVEWRRDAAGVSELVDTRDKADLSWFRTINLFRPLIAINVSRLTSGRPSVAMLARSGRDADRAAAEEARIVDGFYEKRNAGRATLARLCAYALVGTTAWLHLWWDASARAWVPDGAGGLTEAPVGALRERFIPGHQVLIDPAASTIEEARWFLLEERMSRQEVKERFRQPEDKVRGGGLLKQAVSALSGFWSDDDTAGAAGADSVAITTCWERPSPQFPQGRTIVWADSTLLQRVDALPCGVVPIIPLGATERLSVGTNPYHCGIGADMAQPQYDYNLMRSRFLGNVRSSSKPTVIREEGASDDTEAEIEAKLYTEDHLTRTIWHRRGQPPPSIQFHTFPADVLRAAMDDARSELERIAGVHSVSSGRGDANATSGYAIRLLQDSDETWLATIRHNVERFVEQRAELRVRFAAHYVREARAWGLDDAGNPATGDGERVSDLSGLRSGGLVSVSIVETSGTSSTPEALDEQTMALYREGLLGDPADPRTRDVLLKLLHSPAASRAREALQEPAPWGDPQGVDASGEAGGPPEMGALAQLLGAQGGGLNA